MENRIQLPVSRGNHKVPKDTIIFNICSAMDCPSEPLGYCQIPEKCYAKKAERMYKSTLPYRRRQTAYWDGTPLVTIIGDFERELSRRTKVKATHIRFGESGDFRNQDDIFKFFEIARAFPEITVYAFTARRDLDFSDRPDNCVVIGSGFMLDNSFSVIPKEEKEMHAYVCGGDCRTCDLCKSKNNLDIKVVIH